MHIDLSFFDLDGTLYPESSGLWLAIKQRIDDYLLEKMGFESQEAQQIRQKFLMKYGTTLRGLQLEYQIDTEEYLAFVHDLPLNKYLQPDPALRQMLAELNIPKWIFTNSDINHVNNVLAFVGLQNLFEGIIEIHSLNFSCKPQDEAYQKALAAAGRSSAKGCLFIDDSPANIQTARRLGFTTVLISSHSQDSVSEFTIGTIHDLPRLFPALWPNNWEKEV
jgi:putative hydrolase of the HAD superfamily